MALKTHPIFMSFSSGEMSPKMEGRVDFDRFYAGCNKMKNWYATPQGGACTDPGSLFVAAQGSEAAKAQLIPFVFSALQPYIIEMGNLYARFFKYDETAGAPVQILVAPAGAAYSIVTPYATADLAKLRWVQSDFELYLLHPDYKPRVMTRTADNAWTITEMTFTDGPYEDEINIPALTPSHTTATVTERVTNGGFAADTDWTKGGADWTIAAGVATHAATGATTLSQDTGEVNTEIYRVTYTLVSITTGKSLTVSIGGTAGTARTAAGTYTEYLTASAGTNLTFTPLDAATACVIDNVSVVKVITLTAASALFDADHVGDFIRIKHTTNWGHVKVESFVSSTVVRANTLAALDGSATAAAGYRMGAWGEYNGWPSAACFHEGRLLFLGNYEFPNTVWASKSGSANYAVFTPGTADDDPYTFTCSDLDVLRWGKAGRSLALGAYSGEATAIGGGDSPITATNPPRINTETTVGSAEVDAVKAGRAIIYLQRAGKKVLEFAYEYTQDAYQPSDLTMLSDHLMEAGLTFLAFQQEPVPILWALRSDADLIGCTYDKQQKIVGWHEHTTDGVYESIAVIPSEDRDLLWVTVKRTVNSVVRRYVEMFDPAISVQSGLTYSGVPVTTVSGLTHLIGKTVQVVGDGAVYPPQVVPATGIVAINPAASEISIGLGYTCTLITNRPEVQMQSGGTSQGLRKRWNKIIVRVINTMGITINGQIVPARSSEDTMDEAPEAVTGDIGVTNLGWGTDGRITIEQTYPVPAYVSCIMGDLVVGDA